MNHDTVRRCVCTRIESQHAGRNPAQSIQSQDTLVQPGDISGNRSPFRADHREELKFRLAHGQPSLEPGRITPLNAASGRFFYMEALRALFAGRWSNTSRRPGAADRLSADLFTPEATVVHVPGRRL